MRPGFSISCLLKIALDFSVLLRDLFAPSLEYHAKSFAVMAEKSSQDIDSPKWIRPYNQQRLWVMFLCTYETS